ncbi:hypothetical protein [Roseivirga misakiensis]|uniref:HEAT repeat domain-containing protein n=1 Tax=Roseivirga misakiensis TaxID=1563681 RepID=A0A1E5SZM4_9BACT|nr:hypothetical protein [Roseivirga misakiensis]OEK04507.1 hypothetical protein BFP71_13645 [Roseivirga misakiensis]
MDLRKQFLKEHSKENTALIVRYIQKNPEYVNELMDIFLHESYRLVQRSAWVVGDLGRANPDLIQPFIPELIANLSTPNLHVASKRNTMRFLEETTIDEAYWGELYDIALRFLTNNDEPIAVKAFSMTVAFNIVKQIPELKKELGIVIEDLLPYGSPGIKSRGRKILLALQKL